MGVATHLQIELDEYDKKIRTFVPYYETLLEETANALSLLDTPEPVVLDLGTGTGALTESCLAIWPKAHMIGLDTDPAMLQTARVRLTGQSTVELRRSSFMEVDLPAADAMVACIALHHIQSPAEKQAFYRRAFERLRPGGVLASGDCYPAVEQRLASRHRQAWLAYLERTYARSEAEGYLDAWSGEDTYFPLELELGWLREAGFAAEVVWRRAGFAVVAGLRPV